MKSSYDVSIIGSGISGLVCGCYLAKAGVKTLIVEKNAMPGGYCSSFKRNGFLFDACAHSLGGLRKGGPLDTIFNELGLFEKLDIVRHEPSDIVISPENKIYFWSNIKKTIETFQKNFPKEKENIEKFFTDIEALKHISFSILRSKTFDDFLNFYFKDNKLKAILSLPILGNASLSASKISAFTAVALYKEFILDGGYYPEGGMQEFPNALVEVFKQYGGNIIFKKAVESIELKNESVSGIQIKNLNFIHSKYVISNVDARRTFLNLMPKRKIENKLLKILDTLNPSLSIFILYIGTDGKIKSIKPGSNVWYLSDYDVEGMYGDAENKAIDNSRWFMVRLSPDKKSIMMLVTASYGNDEYWKNHRKKLENVFIDKIQSVIPELSEHIISQGSATPKTLFNWTGNYRGSAYGWAGLPSQFAIQGLSQSTFLKNLYLTGHWTTLVQGIPGVAYIGRDTARIVLNKMRKIKA